jgi:hypothetical protein
MSNAWYIEAPTEEACKWIAKDEGVVPPPVRADAVMPTPQQVFDALQAIPEYQVKMRRGTYKRPRQGTVENAIYLDLRLTDGKYAVEIAILKVTGDDQPALVVFKYGRMEEITRITAKLAEVCGPLILWNDAGDPSVVVYPASGA